MGQSFRRSSPISFLIGRSDKDRIISSLADGAGNLILPALEFASEQQSIIIQLLIECTLPLFFLMAIPLRERPTFAGRLGEDAALRPK